MSVNNHLKRFKKDSSKGDLSSIVDRFHKEFHKEITAQKKTKIDKVAFTKLKSKIHAIAEEADNDAILISTFDAHQIFKSVEDSANHGIKSVAFYMKTKWENDPAGYLTLSDIEAAKKYAEKVLPKRLFSQSSKKVASAFDNILKASIKNRFDINTLDKIAMSLDTQEDYDTAITLNGFSLDRADHAEIRSYIAYRSGKDFIDSFSSASAVKDTLSRLSGNISTFDIDKLKGICSEDWGATQATLDKQATVKKIFAQTESVTGKLSLSEALAQANTAHNINPKDGNTYTARKNVLGEFALYVEKLGEDARLLSKFDQLADIIEDTKELPNSWEI